MYGTERSRISNRYFSPTMRPMEVYKCECGKKFYDLRAYLMHVRFCRHASKAHWVSSAIRE